MSITIKDVYGKSLYVAEHASDVRAALQEAVKARADLSGAYLSRAYLSGAYLSRAYLSGAYLSGADLSRADLSRAYLSGADLSRAYLSRADLSRAKNFNPRRYNDLLILFDQPGRVRAYRLVKQDGSGPYNGSITYQRGETYEVPDANTDPDKDCAEGIHLATLPWCVRGWRAGYRILKAEFTAKDIAAIPLGDGKFRVRRCKIVGEVDLAELGLDAEQKVAG